MSETKLSQTEVGQNSLVIPEKTREYMVEAIETTIGEIMIIESSIGVLSGRPNFELSYEALNRVIFARLANLRDYISGIKKEYNPEITETFY